MAKNKLKGQKSKNVFHIASHKTFKAKNKAKPVTTNLKKINIMNHEKVNRMNRAFINIQKELANFSKSLSLKPVPKELINMNHEKKVNRMNRAFINIQKELANFSKSLSLKSVPKELKHHEYEPANVDEATRLMAQL